MVKKYDNIIIDISNIFHRSYNSCITRGYTGKILYQKTIEQVLISLQKIEKTYLWEWGKVYCLFDNPNSKGNLRSEISSDYKASRKKMPKLFFDYLNYLKTFLLSYSNNYILSYVDLLEADDLVLPIVNIIPENESIVVISADLDWSRVINYNNRDIVWYNFNKLYNKDEFYYKFGFYPSINKIVLFKCLAGDESDGIKKVIKGLSKNNIKQLCRDYNSIEEIYIHLNKISYLSQVFKYRIEENIEQLKINKRLIEFVDIKQFGRIEQFLYPCTFKYTELKLLYSGLHIDIHDERVIEYPKKFKENESYSLFKEDKIKRK